MVQVNPSPSAHVRLKCAHKLKLCQYKCLVDHLYIIETVSASCDINAPRQALGPPHICELYIYI